MLDSTARMIATVGIWFSFAIVVAFGLCRMNFSEGSQFLVALFFVTVAAVLGTGIVWLSKARSLGQEPIGKPTTV